MSYAATHAAASNSETAQMARTVRHPLYAAALAAAKVAHAATLLAYDKDPQATWSLHYQGAPMGPTTVWPTGEVRNLAPDLCAYAAALRAAANVYGADANVDSKAAWTAQAIPGQRAA